MCCGFLPCFIDHRDHSQKNHRFHRDHGAIFYDAIKIVTALDIHYCIRGHHYLTFWGCFREAVLSIRFHDPFDYDLYGPCCVVNSLCTGQR